MAKKRTKFGQLTHRDLRAFDQRSTDLVLAAMDAGCTGRVSSNGHAILHNSAGQTTSVPPNSVSLNRSAQNAAADLKRFLEGHTTQPEAAPAPANPTSPITVVEALDRYGMTFSNWMDTNGELSPKDKIEVVPAPDGSPLFSLLPESAPTPVETPAEETEEVVYPVTAVAEANSVTGKTVRNRLRAAGGRDKDGRYRATPSKLLRAGLDVPSPAEPNQTERTDDQQALSPDVDAAEILDRIRSLLGEDPRVQVLKAEKEALSDEAIRQERRAVAAEERCAETEKELGETKARLALVKEAFEA
ncbi:hypothetical protein [Nocardiopsis sp. JB363]|uniref:hypothetical protein n=1 Tax=Nocardiopsis sp. JB363 TaxID=1434837 RepID=UPI00097B118A|nr:hypothetical protein [Nocardiopsis sp. JB363]SIO87021.1 hypothetical protein BQ8420_14710 [Nocardiopsis sp. JB363]